MNAQLLKNLSLCLAMTLFSMITVLGQESTDFVQSVKMSKDQLVIETNGQYQHFILEIVGPDNFLSRKEITKTSIILKKEKEFTLTAQWKEYEFDLQGADLTRIKTPFFWSAAGQGKPLKFFLDDIVFE